MSSTPNLTPVSQISEHHSDVFFKTIADFYTYNRPDDLCEHLATLLSEYVALSDDPENDTALFCASHLRDAAMQNAQIITFLVRLEKAFSNYQNFVQQ